VIEPLVPALSGKSRKSLSVAEQDLMQFIQIIFPKGIQPESQVEAVKQWSCFESVTINPVYELPGCGEARQG